MTSPKSGLWVLIDRMFSRLRDWQRSTFGQAAIGAVLLWSALPPLDLWLLAWIAPVWWVRLIRAEKLPPLLLGDRPPRPRPWLLLAAAVLYFLVGLAVNAWFHSMDYRNYWLADAVYWLGLGILFLAAARLWAARPYLSLWLAGMFLWLAVVQWIRLPYWAVGFGWLALGIYFGCYLPVFIGLSRFGVHVLRLPVILVAPLVYTGLELAQGHLLTGMTMGCLEHSQYRGTMLIQISDLTGCYGVTFLMIFVAACLARMIPCETPVSSSRGWTWWPAFAAVGLLAAVLGYGRFRMTDEKTEPGLSVALVQGSVDVRLDCPADIRETTHALYHQLTCDAIRDANQRSQRIDLIVWPETVFGRQPWVMGDDDAMVPPELGELSPQQFRARLGRVRTETCQEMTDEARLFGLPMLVGVDRMHFGARGRTVYNTAVLITPDKRWCDPASVENSYYDKTHLVPFGEFMPFADSIPWLKNLSPLGSGSSWGARPKFFMVKGVCLAPNICYETVMPHVIRDQLEALREAGHDPQILVNVTNDGWFWGSAELEQHLACGVFRAVEARRPLVIAANTGISASIDGDGRILAEGPVRHEKTILADVRLDRRESWYSRHGDWFAGSCLTGVVLLAVGSVIGRKKSQR